jgi:hypothetical protein
MDASVAGADVISGSTAVWTRIGLCAVSLLAETATNTQTIIAAVAEAARILGRCRARMKSPPDERSPYDIHTGVSKTPQHGLAMSCAGACESRR